MITAETRDKVLRMERYTAENVHLTACQISVIFFAVSGLLRIYFYHVAFSPRCDFQLQAVRLRTARCICIWGEKKKTRAEESGNRCSSDSLRCCHFNIVSFLKVQQSISGRELWCSVASVSFLPDIDSFCVSFLLIFKRKRGLDNYWRQTRDCNYCF